MYDYDRLVEHLELENGFVETVWFGYESALRVSEIFFAFHLA